MVEIQDESVQCCITSPPYWGLRKYSGNQDLIWGGKTDCDHEWLENIQKPRHKAGETNPGKEYYTKDTNNWPTGKTNTCSLCGAWRGAYGLEPTPELYIQHTIEILREIRRVLRKDGVVFWNIEDSYAGSGSPGGDYRDGKGGDDYLRPYNRKGGNLKPKDLCLIPFRVAIAAQEDGWWVRSVIIWSKNNPMPESVTDRPTESHEYILMLTKSARYYWDIEAVREAHSDISIARAEYETRRKSNNGTKSHEYSVPANIVKLNPNGRNLRSVWEFPTQPYKGAHFATFPEALPERCIKAATPEAGCCPDCGAPWVRVIESKSTANWQTRKKHSATGGAMITGANQQQGKGMTHDLYVEIKTLGWKPSCQCGKEAVPSIVLDPFAGSGTTLWVAKRLNRRAIGYEISSEYCELAKKRNAQQVIL